MFDLSEQTATTVYDICNVAVVLAGAIAAIGGIGLYLAGGIKEKYADKKTLETESRIAEANKIAALANEGQAKANQRASEAHERAALLEKEAAEAKLELERLKEKSRPRALTPDQRAALHEHLSGTPRGRLDIYVLGVAGPEASQYACELMRALLEEGFGNGAVNTLLGIQSIPGVQLCKKDPTVVPPHFDALYLALSQAGIVDNMDFDSRLDDDQLWLRVGHKP